MPEEDPTSAGYVLPQLPLPPPPPWPPGGWGSGPRPQPDRRTRRRRVVAGALVVFVLLASGIGAGLLPRSNDASAPLRPARPSTWRADVGAHASAIAAEVEPGIVDVNTVLGAGASVGQPISRGAGTGMVLTSSGEVLTNNHVIQGATKIDITMPDHSGTYTATVLGADYAADVALLQIQGISGLSTVTLGDSSGVTTGQEVVAIGNVPERGTLSVTEGTISDVGRSIAVRDDHGGTEHLTDMIETSAPIQPGNSGGALVDTSGEVIGMITAGGQRVGSGIATSSVGFAIPTSKALDIVNDIRAGNGSATLIIGQAGFLGVLVRPVDSATATQLGLNGTSGALVAGAIAGTPAARAGIKPGAVITAIDDSQIASPETLGPALWEHRPGSQIRVTWVDQDGTHTVTVSLISGPAV
jgi:S1-C subfamily serine protease